MYVEGSGSGMDDWSSEEDGDDGEDEGKDVDEDEIGPDDLSTSDEPALAQISISGYGGGNTIDELYPVMAAGREVGTGVGRADMPTVASRLDDWMGGSGSAVSSHSLGSASLSVSGLQEKRMSRRIGDYRRTWSSASRMSDSGSDDGDGDVRSVATSLQVEVCVFPPRPNVFDISFIYDLVPGGVAGRRGILSGLRLRGQRNGGRGRHHGGAVLRSVSCVRVSSE